MTSTLTPEQRDIATRLEWGKDHKMGASFSSEECTLLTARISELEREKLEMALTIEEWRTRAAEYARQLKEARTNAGWAISHLGKVWAMLTDGDEGQTLPPEAVLEAARLMRNERNQLRRMFNLAESRRTAAEARAEVAEESAADEHSLYLTARAELARHEQLVERYRDVLGRYELQHAPCNCTICVEARAMLASERSTDTAPENERLRNALKQEQDRFTIARDHNASLRDVLGRLLKALRKEYGIDGLLAAMYPNTVTAIVLEARTLLATERPATQPPPESDKQQELRQSLDAASARIDAWPNWKKSTAAPVDYAGRENHPDEPYKNTDPYVGVPIETVRAILAAAPVDVAEGEPCQGERNDDYANTLANEIVKRLADSEPSGETMEAQELLKGTDAETFFVASAQELQGIIFTGISDAFYDGKIRLATPTSEREAGEAQSGDATP